jgi:hypothetical protein
MFRIWLAIDRNFLPVREESVRPWQQPIDPTATKPYGIGVVDELKEIAPGVWFPLRVTTTVYDCDELYRKGRYVVSGRYDLAVTAVDPDPHYDVSFFRNIEFPPDTLVYTVRDGKIIGSEVVPFPKPGRARFLLLLIPLALLCAVIAILVRRRRKSRRASAE